VAGLPALFRCDTAGLFQQLQKIAIEKRMGISRRQHLPQRGRQLIKRRNKMDAHTAMTFPTTDRRHHTIVAAGN
jgi:hypothetical protein